MYACKDEDILMIALYAQNMGVYIDEIFTLDSYRLQLTVEFKNLNTTFMCYNYFSG